MFFLSSESHPSECIETQCTHLLSQFSSGYPRRYCATSMPQDLDQVGEGVGVWGGVWDVTREVYQLA